MFYEIVNKDTGNKVLSVHLFKLAGDCSSYSIGECSSNEVLERKDKALACNILLQSILCDRVDNTCRYEGWRNKFIWTHSGLCTNSFRLNIFSLFEKLGADYQCMNTLGWHGGDFKVSMFSVKKGLMFLYDKLEAPKVPNNWIVTKRGCHYADGDTEGAKEVVFTSLYTAAEERCLINTYKAWSEQ